MSKSMNSPTARLLQTSRLFSLPRPLPQPALELATSAGVYKASPTATLPYPTHQAITTPPSSLHRGDWGLKRALPGKTTKNTSTPHIRVKAQDNTEHITPFESAADHTQTVAKWRQMGIPITVQHNENKNRYHSVYDEHLDVTDKSSANLQPQDKRWKHQGPWLTGMQNGEFELYISKQIMARKDEFRRYVQERMLEQRINEENRDARDQGRPGEMSAERKAEIRQEIVESYSQEERRLRNAHVYDKLNSELTRLICDFLDMPEFVEPATDLPSKVYRSLDNRIKPPPSTHPGAGLSYLRTNAIMENHPSYGPQAHRSPVLARVLLPRSRAAMFGDDSSSANETRIGVGGIAASDRSQKTTSVKYRRWDQPQPTYEPGSGREYLDANRMSQQLDPDLVGGNKYWVNPSRAMIDAKGRIQMDVAAANEEAVLVKMGLGDEVSERKAPQAGQFLQGRPQPRADPSERLRQQQYQEHDSRYMSELRDSSRPYSPPRYADPFSGR